MSASADSRLKASFFQDSPDHRILNTALALQKREHARPVVVISKDTNLRQPLRQIIGDDLAICVGAGNALHLLKHFVHA